jgi:probable HAF family extracellular repeat protein
MPRALRKWGLGALCSLLCWGIATAGAASYRIIDLGTLGGNQSQATAINNLGQVTGTAKDAAGTEWVFLWERGAMRNLNVADFPTSTRLNNFGQITVNKYVPPGDYAHAFLWDRGTLTDLGNLGGKRYVSANGLNDAGQVVGSSETAIAYRKHAFLWEKGVIKDLGILTGLPESSASGINRTGQVVGYTAGSGSSRAIRWQGETVTDLEGLPGYQYHSATDINDAGQVVGISHNGGTPRGFLWDQGVVRDLGTIPGGSGDFCQPYAINNRGLVVGTASRVSWNHAFLWKKGVMTDLNDLIPQNSGWFLECALDINDSGRIVGYGQYQTYSRRAFLLIPPLAPWRAALDLMLIPN